MSVQAMEPKFVEMTDHYKSEMRRLREKAESLEKLLAQNEDHSMQLRQRMLQVLSHQEKADSIFLAGKGRLFGKRTTA